MKSAVSILKDPENCKMGQKTGSFYRIKKKVTNGSGAGKGGVSQNERLAVLKQESPRPTRTSWSAYHKGGPGRRGEVFEQRYYKAVLM